MKRLNIILALLVGLSVSAKDALASCAVAILTKERIVIASDKRRASARKGKFIAKQDESKLRKLPNDMILLVSGILRDTRPEGFDVFEVANCAARKSSNIHDVSVEIEKQIAPKLSAVLERVRSIEPALYKRSLAAGKPCLEVLILARGADGEVSVVRKSFSIAQKEGKKMEVTKGGDTWSGHDGNRVMLFGVTHEIQKRLDVDPQLPFRNSLEDNARGYVKSAAKLYPNLVSATMDVVVVDKDGVTWKK